LGLVGASLIGVWMRGIFPWGGHRLKYLGVLRGSAPGQWFGGPRGGPFWVFFPHGVWVGAIGGGNFPKGGAFFPRVVGQAHWGFSRGLGETITGGLKRGAHGGPTTRWGRGHYRRKPGWG